VHVPSPVKLEEHWTTELSIFCVKKIWLVLVLTSFLTLPHFYNKLADLAYSSWIHLPFYSYIMVSNSSLPHQCHLPFLGRVLLTNLEQSTFNEPLSSSLQCSPVLIIVNHHYLLNSDSLFPAATGLHFKMSQNKFLTFYQHYFPFQICISSFCITIKLIVS
jgi:hypothetical protein